MLSFDQARAFSARAPRTPVPPGASVNLADRRAFLHRTGLVAALALLAPPVLARRPRLASRQGTASLDEVVADTFLGLAAFVVPGPDEHSVHQGASTAAPGGIQAGAGFVVPLALDVIQLAPPPFASFSQLVAVILNDVAEAVHPGVEGPFPSSFSRLAFEEKQICFAILDGDPELSPLGAALPTAVAFVSYSEVGVFDPDTKTLVGQPVGWTISGYTGVSDGRAELKGYFKPKKN